MPGHPFNVSVPHCFARALAMDPHGLAILSPGDPWTYLHLDRVIRSIQATLRKASLPSQSVICIAASDPNWVAAAMLAVLRERHVYCTLDPRQPTGWLEDAISLCNAAALLTDEPQRRRFRSLVLPCLSLVSEQQPVPVDTSLSPALDPSDPAYIVFTSGSTGAPKAITHSHANLLHEVKVHTETLNLTKADRFSALYGLHAIGSNRDLYAALLNGATYCPFPHRELGMGMLKKWLTQQRITILHSVPPLFRELMRHFDADEKLYSVRTTFLAGDRVVAEDVALHRRHFSETARFYTGIGASETSSLYCHGFVPREKSLDGKSVPSGKPVPGYEMRISNGEIIVTGDFLALGLGTFFTGDRGFIDEEGDLHFLGRLDQRLKINGQPVEILHVEAKLRELPHVQDCLVLPIEKNGKPQLLAYLIADENLVELPRLRETLKASLPLHAIPHAFICLDRFPLAENGKIARHLLPSPTPTALNEDPRIAEVFPSWKKIFPTATLRDQNVDFYEQGGDSLAAVSLIAEIDSKFGIELSPEDFLRGLSMGKLADRIGATPVRPNEEAVEITRHELALLKAATSLSSSLLVGKPFARGVGSELSERQPGTSTLLWLPVRNSPYQVRLLREAARHRQVIWLPSGLDLLDDEPSTTDRLFSFYARNLVQRGVDRVEIAGMCRAGILGMKLAIRLEESGIKVGNVLVLDYQPPLPPWIAFPILIFDRFLAKWSNRKEASLLPTRAARDVRQELRAKFFELIQDYRRFSGASGYRGRGIWLVSTWNLSTVRSRLIRRLYFRNWKVVPLEGNHFSFLTDVGATNLSLVLDHLKGNIHGKGPDRAGALAPLPA